MDDATVKRLKSESLCTTWLAARLGIGEHRLDAMRRAGELLAVRADGDWWFPAWQFDSAGRPRAIVPELVRTARTLGLDAERLYESLTVRRGIGRDGRLVDALRAGRDDDVLRALRLAG